MNEWQEAESQRKRESDEAKAQLAERTFESLLAGRTPAEIERIKFVIWAMFPDVLQLRVLH